MKKIFTALVASLAFLSSCSSTPVGAAEEGPWVDPKRFTIEDDGGGVVNEFRAALSYFKKENMAVSISGYCASACTLVLSTDYNLDVCVNKGMRFGIHKPFFADVLGNVANTIPYIYRSEMMWKEEFFKKYPEWLRTIIDEQGGAPAAIQGDKTNEMLWVSYEQVKAHMRTCITKQEVEKSE
jgi:hypothetical protein